MRDYEKLISNKPNIDHLSINIYRRKLNPVNLSQVSKSMNKYNSELGIIKNQSINYGDAD